MDSPSLRRLFAFTALAGFGLGTAAFGAEGAAPTSGGAAQIEEVVVTAQKREQRLQDVPIAVTAFGSQALEAAATQSLTDLNAKTPNVVLAPVGAYPYASAFFIRGLGFADVESTFEPAVGVEMNGVYLARNSGALQDFFDIDSVEVLRGPQGTLYGRNTIGGVVSVRTKKPDGSYGGEIQATVGDHGRREVRLGVEFPLIKDVLAGRVSLLYKDYDGYWNNAYTHKDVGGNEVVSGRATLVFTPTTNFDATLVIDKDHERGTGSGFSNASLPDMVLSKIGFPADDPSKPYTIYDNGPTYAHVETAGAALTANWDLGFATLTSVTGWRIFKDNVLTDFDGSSITFLHAMRDQSHQQVSEEVRIASKGKGPIDYVAGVYYLDQHYDIHTDQTGLIYGSPTTTLSQYAGQKNRAWAAFGQVDWHVTGKWTLTAGGRYSYEEKDFRNQPIGSPNTYLYSDNWDNFSPKLGVNYEFNRNLMAYASYSKGFRSGGFNGRAATQSSAGPYNSETVDSYEIGVKSELFERRLRLNLAAFDANYNNMQVGVQALTSDGLYQSIVTNAASSKIWGVEAEAHGVVGHGLTLDASIAYLDASFDQFYADLVGNGVKTDNSGLPLAYAPKWSGSFGGTWTHDTPLGLFTANATAAYQDNMYTSFAALNATSSVLERKSNLLVDATLSLTSHDERWKATLWGKNLGNKVVINNTFTVGPLDALRIYAPPLTWGVDLAYKF